MHRIVCLITAGLLAAPALATGPDGEAKLAGLLRGRTAGPAQSCLARLSIT